MIVIKNNKEYPYDENKIKRAIIQAYNQISLPDFDEIDLLVDEISDLVWTKAKNNTITNKEIENLTISVLYREVPEVARIYSSYKMNRERINKNPTEIEKVLYVKEDIAQENANKNPELTHIKNAYLAEIPSKKEMRKALPKDCLAAHDKSIVYFHDMAYSIRDCHNCELLNLDALLQDGFELGGRWIKKPHSFATACTVVTQILSHVTGNTYGGCTINLLHLAKFVDVSRKKIKKEVEKELDFILEDINDYGASKYEKIRDKMIKERLSKEIKQGMQTFDYQNSTLCSNVGQAVFLTVSVYLNEDPNYTDDLILVFKEMLKQRIHGIPNKDGICENPNFPKILYFLDEDTMRGGKYYDVTKLCAECSSKRLVPDYMSVKKHLELKGVITPSMGKRNTIAHLKSFEPRSRVSA